MNRINKMNRIKRMNFRKIREFTFYISKNHEHFLKNKKGFIFMDLFF